MNRTRASRSTPNTLNAGTKAPPRIRPKMIACRVSPTERQLIEAAAQSANTTLSRYIREIVMCAARESLLVATENA